MQSIIGTLKRDVLLDLRNQGTINQPQVGPHNLRQKICLKLLVGVASKAHFENGLFVVSKRIVTAAKMLSKFNPAASCRKSFDAISDVIH